jgi:aryl-alcohol dehydrogenase-like predicted oxidoreductase
MALIDVVKKLGVIASELNCTLSQLAIAWCLKNSNVSSVITGATQTEQLIENVGAIDIKNKLTNEIMNRINHVGNLINN